MSSLFVFDAQGSYLTQQTLGTALITHLPVKKHQLFAHVINATDLTQWTHIICINNEHSRLKCTYMQLIDNYLFVKAGTVKLRNVKNQSCCRHYMKMMLMTEILTQEKYVIPNIPKPEYPLLGTLEHYNQHSKRSTVMMMDISVHNVQNLTHHLLVLNKEVKTKHSATLKCDECTQCLLIMVSRRLMRSTQ